MPRLKANTWGRIFPPGGKIMVFKGNIYPCMQIMIFEIFCVFMIELHFSPGYYENLKTHDSFDSEDCKEPATALLWLLYYLAQHYDHNKNFQKALETVDEAINHTPTLIGKILGLNGHVTKM